MTTDTQKIRTRFAPSPTGFQHIGGMRTAFYAWLLAKKNGGDFILRIEDTDQERLVPGAIKFLLEEFQWFDVIPDEGPSVQNLKDLNEYYDTAPDLNQKTGPYIQSMRLPLYKKVAEELISSGYAYRCDCTQEMLEQERNEQMARKEVPGYSGYCRSRDVSADSKHVVRFKMPTERKTVRLDDAIRGTITWDAIPLKDPVLLKSDGFPTYHLAVVVDDNDMKVTHVLRGEEWLSSAPLHVMLYEALKWEKPVFAHLPVVLGQDGKKLSKRHGATLSSMFREEGYLPEALLNYVVLVGWSPGEGNNQEIFTREELINIFSLEHINPASAVFDFNKLQWMNGMYIRAMTPEKFLKVAKSFVIAYFNEKGIPFNEDIYNGLLKLAPHVQERCKVLKEVAPMVYFLFVKDLERDMTKMIPKDSSAESVKALLAKCAEVIGSVSNFVAHDIETSVKSLMQELSLKPGAVFSPLRIAVTGKNATPPLFDSIEALGKDKSVIRILEAINML